MDNPSQQENLKISVGEGERRLPVYFLLDTSGAMWSAPIEAMSRGLEQFKLELQGDTFALETVWVGVITFGGRAEFVTKGLVPFSQFVPPSLTAGGQTPLGQALWLLIESLDNDLRRPVKGGPKADWRPLVFILTDGEPTDDWQEPRENILQRDRSKVCKVITVGCGPHINPQKLREIAIGETFNMDDDTASIRKLFEWISISVVDDEPNSQVPEESEVPISARPPIIDFGCLQPGTSSCITIRIEGGPAKATINNERIQVTPSEIGEEPTDIEVTINAGSTCDLIWDTLHIHGDKVELEIPIIGWWDEKFEMLAPEESLPARRKKRKLSSPVPKPPPPIVPEVPDKTQESSKPQKGDRTYVAKSCPLCGRNLHYDSNEKAWLKCENCKGLHTIGSMLSRIGREIGSGRSAPLTINEKWFITLLLSGFLGLLGADRFFLRQHKLAIWKLFTLGGAGIWWIVDFIYFGIQGKDFTHVLQKKPAYNKYSSRIAVLTSIIFVVFGMTLLIHQFSTNISYKPPVVTQSVTINPSGNQAEITPNVSVVPSSGVIGTQFIFKCAGFTPSDSIKLYIDSKSANIISAVKTANTQGLLEFLLPTSSYSAGAYEFRAEDMSTGKFSKVNFMVIAKQEPVQKPSATIGDLTDPGKGFEARVDNNGESRSEFVNNQYCIYINNTDNYVYRINRAMGKYEDFDIEMDISQKGTGTASGRSRGYQAGGLIFHAEVENSGYVFWISRFGWYKIQDIRSGKDVIPLSSSSFINTGTDTNRLRIECSQSTAKLYINDKELSVVTSIPKVSGYIGVAAVGNKSDVCFNNLKIVPIE